MGSAQPTLGPKGRELLLLVHYTGEEHSAVQITDFTPSPGEVEKVILEARSSFYFSFISNIYLISIC